jgi:hypothetical protein
MKYRTGTYIYSDMTNNCSVERQPDILRIISGPIRSRSGRRPGILINDECTLHIDLDGTGVRDRAVYLRRIRAHAEVPRARRRHRINGWALFLSLSRCLLQLLGGRLGRFRRHHELG